MWIMGREGFISIVEKPGDRALGRLTLRARVRGDLETLRATLLNSLSPIESHTGTDYPYRATAAREDVECAMSLWVRQIDYANFKDAVAQTQGKARASVYARVWEALRRLEVLPAPARAARSADKVPAADAYGGVLIDAQGRVLLREPSGHFGGYVWTFAKGRPDAGESPAETALREVREETGYTARIEALLPVVFAGTTTSTVMFLMTPESRTDLPLHETARVLWCTPEEAEARIRQSHTATGRERDLAILRTALAEWHKRSSMQGC